MKNVKISMKPKNLAPDKFKFEKDVLNHAVAILVGGIVGATLGFMIYLLIANVILITAGFVIGGLIGELAWGVLRVTND